MHFYELTNQNAEVVIHSTEMSKQSAKLRWFSGGFLRLLSAVLGLTGLFRVERLDGFCKADVEMQSQYSYPIILVCLLMRKTKKNRGRWHT